MTSALKWHLQRSLGTQIHGSFLASGGNIQLISTSSTPYFYPASKFFPIGFGVIG